MKNKAPRYNSVEEAVKAVGKEKALTLLNKGAYDDWYRKTRRMKEQALLELAKKDTRFKDLTTEQIEEQLRKLA